MNIDYFDKHLGTHGVFEVFRANNWDTRILVKAFCSPEDTETSTKIAQKLYELQWDEYSVMKNIRIWIYINPITIRGTKRKQLQHFTLISNRKGKSPSAFVDGINTWLEQNTKNINPPLQPTKDLATNWSVGPCSFQSEDGSKYVKVRFDQVSIPWYLTSNKKWDRDKTKNKLVSQVGVILARELISILDKRSTEILKRAKTRPLNLSNIGQYAPHNIKYALEFRPGVFAIFPSNDPKLADPNNKPVPIFEYDTVRGRYGRSTNVFIILDSEIYRIDCFYQPRYGLKQSVIEKKFDWNNYNKSDYFNSRVIFSRSDMSVVPKADEYVREKITRAVQAKM